MLRSKEQILQSKSCKAWNRERYLRIGKKRGQEKIGGRIAIKWSVPQKKKNFLAKIHRGEKTEQLLKGAVVGGSYTVGKIVKENFIVV